MLTSARKTMPALDYVSLIRAVYGDRRALLIGAAASAGVAVLSGIKADAPILFLIAALVITIGLGRYANMRAFWSAGVGDDDSEAAEHWELRALAGGGLVALAHGLWCLVAILFVTEPFAVLAACTLSIASTVGMVARNFGLDRLITVQVLALSGPLWLAMILRGDPFYQVLAALLVVLLFSFRKLARDIRSILISAVHGRAEVARLAAELDMAIVTMAHGLIMLDEHGTVTLTNKHADRSFSRLGIAKLKGRSLTEGILPAMRLRGDIPATAITRLCELISSKRTGKVLLPMGEATYVEVTVSARQGRCVLLFEDISERVAAEERIGYMAHHDMLTGLPNRSSFAEHAGEELARRAVLEQPSALLLIDIDEFKTINDSFGQETGDDLLRQVSTRLRHALPEDARLARLGSDEFVVLAAMGKSRDDAQRLASTILSAFQAPFNIDGLTLVSSVSIGIAINLDKADTLDVLMSNADLALHAAKQNGRGRFQMFHQQMDIDHHLRQRLKADLRQAVASGELSLVFQPLFDITTRRIVSCEALARWTHPELGPVSPASFIPLAEEIGLISDITAWVIRSAAEHCMRWDHDVSVAVNISARDFRGIDLVALVDTTLAETGLPPGRLELEVTETAVIEERDLAYAALSTLGNRGIAIALDDFGTGYSSLSYLSALPFTKLKIDRSFLIEIENNPRALRLLANVAQLGRDLDLTVVAEGVESEAQLAAMLAETQIQQVQGFFFSRPLAPCDLSRLIETSNGMSAEKRKRG